MLVAVTHAGSVISQRGRSNGELARRFNTGLLIYGDESMYFEMRRAAVTVAGGAAALCLGSVPEALAAQAPNTDFVPCNPYALHRAINNQSFGETLVLAPGCTYYLPDAQSAAARTSSPAWPA